MRTHHESPPPIAIIGMAARLPGGVNSIPSMYQFLRGKKDGLREVPESRFNIDGFHNDGDVAYSMRQQKAYFLDDDISMMDASFFGSSDMEAAGSDPRARLLLEVVYECLENAGKTTYRGERMGCYIGAWGVDWSELTLKDGQQRNPMIGAAAGSFFLSSYIAWNLDLHGPTMSIETACSASMVALHEACQALYSGECSSAIVGGANLILTPTLHMSLSSSGVLSPDGICKTFDASADGFGRAEAVNAVLVKPLDAAIRDGDAVRAVIRATTVNNDGHTLILTTPSAEAQEELIRQAYKKAGIEDTDQTAYFECHGTGTMAGDTAEMSAVSKVFPKGIHVGSVSIENRGRDETDEVRRNQTLAIPKGHPGSPVLSKQSFPFESANLTVPKEELPWPADRKERISVNNFGVGGTNVHVILDSASSLGLNNARNGLATSLSHPRLLVVSANSEKSLARRIADIEIYVKENPNNLADLAFTLGERREHLAQRAFLLETEARESGSFHVGTADCKATPEVTFVFTGQGAQWPAMGKALIETFEGFRRSIEQLDRALEHLDRPPAWRLKDLLSKNSAPDEFNRAELAQPLCCAVQIGLVNLLARWGIAPASVIGHSSGEIAAAYAAGAITAEDSIIIAYHRGKILNKVTRKGGMAAVSLGREQVTPYLVDGVVIACENSQHSVTLSGDFDELNCIVDNIKSDDPDALCRILRVDKAYHSAHMQDAGEDYEVSLHGLSANDELSMLPFFSSVTGKKITDPTELGAGYWRQNLESPVLFLTATRAILESEEEDTRRVFLEIGPHSALSGPLRQILSEHQRGESCFYVASLVRGEDPTTSVLYTAGNLYNLGVPVNLSAVNGKGSLLVDLPPYPWQHDTRHWDQTPAVEAWRLRKYPHHELLGSRVLGATDIEPSWRNNLVLDDAPWLYGHRIMGKTLFPGAGYIAMAGEAIQQLTSKPNVSYQISHLLLKYALFLDTNECVELITNLRPVRISDIQDSDWHEFSITAVQAGEAIRLCVGQVRIAPPSASSSMPLEEKTKLKRRVASTAWYKALREVGMDYNREFRGLDDVYGDPIRHEATATVKTTKVSPSRYVMHPTTIDRCLQVISVAMFHGLARNINIRSLPVLFEDIFIGPEAEELCVQAQADLGNGNFVLGDLGASADEETVLSIKGMRLHVLGDDGSLQQDSELATRPAWMPHIDFLSPKALAKPPPPMTQDSELRNRVVDLYILESARRAKDVEPTEEHLLKYKRWLMMSESRIAKQSTWRLSDYGYAPDCPFDSSNSLELTNWLRDQADQFPVIAPLLACIQRLLDNIVGVLDGTSNALHLLMEDDGLKQVYDFVLSFDSCQQFFAILGHSNPELNILEVGAGTGGATARFLEYLHAPDGSRMYARYTFTDVSAGFLAAAKERFSKFDAMEYAVLNINEDPAQQGYKLGTYDLIIASNVVHATPSLKRSLANLKSLLAPGGRLFLQEIGEEFAIAEYIFGLLPGWWVGENDQRVDKPYVPVDRWRQELTAVGFDGIDFAIHEESQMVNLVSTCPLPPSEDQTVNLLVQEPHCPWVVDVERYFSDKGYQVNMCSLGRPPQAEGIVISLLDATEPFLFNVTEDTFQQLKDFLLSPLVKHVLWVTRMSQITSGDPRYGLIHGFLRALHAESHSEGKFLSMFDIDDIDGNSVSHLLKVHDHWRRNCSTEEDSRRDEYALVDGVVHVSRYEATDTETELQRPAKDIVPRRLGIESTGLIDSMFWREDNPAAPGKDEDIITALGLIASPEQLGLEGSGVIDSVGPGVSKLRKGDRVIFLGPGCFATHVTVPAAKVIPLPAEWSLEEGATSPIVSLTAAVCLLRLGNLRRGQSVLIHAAAGGVGIAAIRICKGVGAKIYATVGNDEKAQYLVDTFGIRRSHIFHSRDSSFYADLMRETDGRGADIVLSSLSGELLRTSWKCVAPGGTMFDISRRDVLADAMLPMKHFVGRRSFVTVDLGEYMDEATLDSSAEFSDSVKKGLVGAVSPVSCFAAADVADAFRYMQIGQHMGKILVRMPDDLSELPTKDTRAQVSFSPDNAYLLCGGLGGLGRALSNWMVERGARCLLYLSPSAGEGEDHQAFAEELKCQGCRVVYVKGTASETHDVQRTISQSPKPVKGVVQLALALRDTSLERMTFEDWTVPLAAKAHGTWNLHQAFQDTPLDFFLMFGSIAGVTGMAGQCNYSAANSFIHALARHRHSLGQPASVLDLGPVADIGYVSRSPEIVKNFSGRFEWRFTKEQEVLDAVEALIYHSSKSKAKSKSTEDNGSRYDLHHIVFGLVSVAPWAHRTGDTRMSILSNRAQRMQDSSGEADDIVDFVAQVEADPEMLNRPSTEEFLIRKAGYMIKSPAKAKGGKSDVAGKQDLKAMGNIPIDSLIAIEARAWARKRLGVQIPLSEITAAGNVKGLVGLAIQEMKKRHSVT
ncbi:putative Polyketide synthase (JCVI) [Aspergillus mulundensis]|uniref:Polyketide synthase, putative (JCVI) n=1 Tax=Aspergillus mulundensis TaxID=1810919 RepID=A0A3D8RS11_9EURO|nr:Polyketide synthase, putative (JCVI) [Aspergillus mulundensis]RDW76877.1 Polyketide synthase, putative (JCVI) [Aspergillus mulundensis]